MTSWQRRVIVVMCRVLIRIIRHTNFNVPYEETALLEDAVDKGFDDYDGK